MKCDKRPFYNDSRVCEFVTLRQKLEDGVVLDVTADYGAIHNRWMSKGYKAVPWKDNKEGTRVVEKAKLATCDCAGCKKLKHLCDIVVYEGLPDKTGKRRLTFTLHHAYENIAWW